MHQGWRRFRPKLAQKKSHHAPQSLFINVRSEITQLLNSHVGTEWKGINPEYLRHLTVRHSELLRSQNTDSQNKSRQVDLIVGLLLRTPAAALLQLQVDSHPHGFHNPKSKIFELIDFNDSFVECVLSLDPHQLTGFSECLKTEMIWFCKQLHTTMFSDIQYEAISKGLAREIAVYNGAIEQGLTAAMGSRIEDAKGIDMIIGDPLTGKSMNIDCKTPSAYRYRLEDLIREGRISNDVAIKAEADDFCKIISGEAGNPVHIVLFCVRPERYGEVIDFRFANSDALGERLREIIASNDI